MQIKTTRLVFVGIVLAFLAWHYQTSNPPVASFSGLIGAFLFLIAARRLTREKKRLKAEKAKNRGKNYR